MVIGKLLDNKNTKCSSQGIQTCRYGEENLLIFKVSIRSSYKGALSVSERAAVEVFYYVFSRVLLQFSLVLLKETHGTVKRFLTKANTAMVCSELPLIFCWIPKVFLHHSMVNPLRTTCNQSTRFLIGMVHCSCQ